MEHGGDIYTNGIFKGKSLMDFSSNINPLGVPEGFRKNISEAVDCAEVYPDAQYRKLRENLKTYLENYKLYFGGNKSNCNFKIAVDSIIPGNGASEIIDIAISCFKSVCIVVPSFVEYEKEALKWNCGISYSPLDADMSFNYKDILSKMETSDCLVIGNPNNPNGGVIDRKKFEEVIKYCESNGKSIIVDEAFVEFTGNSSSSFIELACTYKCIIVVRALTKFFAIPGIRLGYGISSNKDIICRMRKKQNAWSVNCFAEVAAKYVLCDLRYMSDSIKWIISERSFMQGELKNIDIIENVYESSANFVLCRLSYEISDELYDFCIKRGALIRVCRNFRNLDGRYIRLAIKDRERNKKIIDIIKQFSQEKLLKLKV